MPNEPVKDESAEKAEPTTPEADEPKAEDTTKTEPEAEKADPAPEAKADPEPEAEASAPAEPPEVPEDLAELDEDALRSLWDDVEKVRLERIDSLASEADVDVVAGMNDAQKRIAAEISGRIEKATELARKVDEVKSEDTERVLPTERVPKPIAAAAKEAASKLESAPETRQAAPDTETVDQGRPKAAWLASIGGPGTAPGAELNIDGFMALWDRVKSQGSGRLIAGGFDGDGVPYGDSIDGSPAYFAAVPGYDQLWLAGERRIPKPLTMGNGPEENDRLIAEAVADHEARLRGEDPRQASVGGDVRQSAICDPPDVIREQPDSFTDEERVAPSFPSRPIGHLGFTFTPGPAFGDVTSGVGIWTETNQANVNPAGGQEATWKPIVDLTCGTPLTVKALAVVASARYDITMQMSSPERLGALMNALGANRARAKEARVLNLLDATLGKYQWQSDLGALPEFIEMLQSLVSNLPVMSRQSPGNFTVAIPPRLAAALSVDVAKKGNTDNDFGISNVLGQVQSAVEGVASVVSTLDGTDAAGGEPAWPYATPRTPAQGIGDVPSLYDNYRVRVYPASDYIFAETGEINSGTYRSTAEVRQNKAVYFTEEFLILAKHGPTPGGYVDVELCPSGARAGLATAETCNPAS